MFNNNKYLHLAFSRVVNVYVFSLGILALWWGAVLVLPFGQFANSTLYDYMSYLAPEYAWGYAAWVAGALMVLGALKGCERMSKLGLMVGCLLWGFVLMTYLLSIPSSTAVPTTAFLVWAHVMGHLVLCIRPEVLKERF
ncbi:hypothetical protein QFZ58_002036 [Streptomyces sp. B1I3]|nr:hypothetical protein [Streptomyces sp. B1I3]